MWAGLAAPGSSRRTPRTARGPRPGRGSPRARPNRPPTRCGETTFDSGIKTSWITKSTSTPYGSTPGSPRPPRRRVIQASSASPGTANSKNHKIPFQRCPRTMWPNSCASTNSTSRSENRPSSSVSQSRIRSVGPSPTATAFAWVVRSCTSCTSTGVPVGTELARERLRVAPQSRVAQGMAVQRDEASIPDRHDHREHAEHRHRRNPPGTRKPTRQREQHHDAITASPRTTPRAAGATAP